MSISFNKLYNHFHDNIASEYNVNHEIELLDVELLTPNFGRLLKNCVYIATSSTIIKNIDKINNVPLILLQDVTFDFSNYSNLSIIELNNNKSTLEVFNEIKSILRLDTRYNQFKVKLLELVVNDAGLKEIVDVASTMIGNPLIVIDLSFKVLVSCPIETISDTLWYDNVQKGYCSYEFIAELKKLKVIKEGRNKDKPFEVTCPESPTKKVVSRIRVENRVVGNILLLECQNTIEEDDYIYLELISNIISKELKKKHFYKNTRNTLREEIIYDLLENNLVDDRIIRERLEHSALVFNNYICIHAIDISKYKMKHSIYERFLETQILKFFPHGYLIYYKGYIVIINTSKDNNLEESTSKEVRTFLTENNLKMGLSNQFTSIKKCNIFYNQAVEALKVGSIIDNKQSIYKFEDIQPYVFLYRLKDSIKAEDINDSALNLLKKYDEENQSELYKTLYLYLKNNHNITKSSEEIHVHRNTLRYRLEKITEILGYNIDEDDNSFKLYNSIKLMDFYNKINN